MLNGPPRLTAFQDFGSGASEREGLFRCPAPSFTPSLPSRRKRSPRAPEWPSAAQAWDRCAGSMLSGRIRRGWGHTGI